TPGIFDAKKKLERAMVRCAWSSLNGADIVVLILDSSAKIDDMTSSIMSRLKDWGKKVVFLLNKIDLNSKHYLDNLHYLTDNFPQSSKFNISALSGKGVNDFLTFLKNNAALSPWLYDSDDMTTLPMRFLAAEITR